MDCAAGAAAVLALAAGAAAQSPVRDLPGPYTPGATMPVTITVGALPGTLALGAEDRPPAGWVVSNISNGGEWDDPSQKVKWGPFFGASIPPTLTYDVTAPLSASGPACFTGLASFDGLDQPIGGDACIPAPIPAVSTLGLALLAGAVASLGAAIVRRRSARAPAA